MVYTRSSTNGGPKKLKISNCPTIGKIRTKDISKKEQANFNKGLRGKPLHVQRKYTPLITKVQRALIIQNHLIKYFKKCTTHTGVVIMLTVNS